MIKEYFSPPEASEYLAQKGAKFTVGTLAVMRCRGQGPRFLKIGQRVRYRVDDLNAFLASKTQTFETSDSLAI